jgi:DNA-binding transcriptional LysR family regulator
MDLNSTLFFVTVATAGSFTEASRRLRVPKSTISEKVAELETRLGVTLMIRTTRKLKLTEAGSAFLRTAEIAINSLQIAEDEASKSQKTPTGTLRITAPGNSVSFVIMKAVAEYRRKFPAVKIELDFSDRRLDLIGEGYDIAFRPGHLPDSNLLAKRVGRASRILVAAPSYLKTRAPLKHPRDLRNHTCLTLVFSSVETVWTLRTKDGRNAKVNVTESLSSNALAALKELVLMGEGIALLPNSVCKSELTQRTFTRVLPEWATAEVPVHLVYPPQRYSSAKVREMIPLLEQCVRELYL